MPEEMKLLLLSTSLPPSGQAELQRRQEEYLRGTGPQVRYADVWNWVYRAFSQDTQEATKEALRSLRPEHSGQLTVAAWMEYTNQFRLLYSRLDHPQEDEVSSRVVAKILGAYGRHAPKAEPLEQP